MAFRKAERRRAKGRVCLSGPAGSGKTLSALFIAYGITEDWNKIGLVDTENHSGELYQGTTKAGVFIGDYLYDSIEPPYTPEKYIAAIKEAEKAGIEVLVIDSLSHAWAGEGGLLDQQGKIADRTGNSWTAWRNITPKHNALVEAILNSPLHIVATVRSKTEYAQVTEDGKHKVKKLGMAPIQRDGLEYEFTLFLDVSAEHIATASKDRTSLFDGQFFTPSPATGKALLEWLNSGTDTPPPAKEETPQTSPPQQTPPPATEKSKDGKVNWSAFWPEVKKLGLDKEQVHKLAGTDSIADWTQAQIDQLLKKLKEQKGVA